MNTPSIGDTLQHFFTNIQVNISPAANSVEDRKVLLSLIVLYDLLMFDAETTFSSSLGQFAVPHIDKHDAPAALMAMMFSPSIPEGYNPGIFAYHDFKLFIRPLELSIVYFTGLHRHGGTAPSPSSGQPSVSWAYRLAVICYPNGPTILGESRNPLVPFVGGSIVKQDAKPGDKDRKDVLKIPPEIRRRERYLSILWNT